MRKAFAADLRLSLCGTADLLEHQVNQAAPAL
jgi:hypothetical protein